MQNYRQFSFLYLNNGNLGVNISSYREDRGNLIGFPKIGPKYYPNVSINLVWDNFRES